MKKLATILVTGLVILGACGSKQQQSTTPSNSTGADAKSGAMGGKTYGGKTAPAPTPSTDAPSADPCAMP
jgi:hypothetical protein